MLFRWWIIPLALLLAGCLNWGGQATVYFKSSNQTADSFKCDKGLRFTTTALRCFSTRGVLEIPWCQVQRIEMY